MGRSGAWWVADISHEVHSNFSNNSASWSPRTVSWLAWTSLKTCCLLQNISSSRMTNHLQSLDKVCMLHLHVSALDHRSWAAPEKRTRQSVIHSSAVTGQRRFKSKATSSTTCGCQWLGSKATYYAQVQAFQWRIAVTSIRSLAFSEGRPCVFGKYKGLRLFKRRIKMDNIKVIQNFFLFLLFLKI